MNIGEKRIDETIISHLRNLSFDGNVARLGGELDRSTYLSVNKALEGLGGKWNKKVKGHVFDGSPEEIIGDAISTGIYLDAKTVFQFFETPGELADAMLGPIDMDRKPFFRILEPSAGNGALLKAIQRRGDHYLFGATAIEIDPKRETILEDRGVNVLIADFLTVTPKSSWLYLGQHPDDSGGPVGLYDLVIMNPPFARSQDTAHVKHAYDFLDADGDLVAIMGSGWTFRADRKAVEFRHWLERVGGTWRMNDSEAFKESGTLANTVTVRINNAQRFPS